MNFYLSYYYFFWGGGAGNTFQGYSTGIECIIIIIVIWAQKCKYIRQRTSNNPHLFVPSNPPFWEKGPYFLILTNYKPGLTLWFEKKKSNNIFFYIFLSKLNIFNLFIDVRWNLFSQHGPESMMAIAFTRRPSVVVVVNNCGSFWYYYSCSPVILQTYQGWYSTLPQYVSENSVELLDFGETLKLKN